MKGGYTYTIVFTFVISAVFTAFLAAANAFYLPTIKKNEEFALKRSILYVLDVKAEKDSEINAIFNESIEKKHISGLDVYVLYDSGRKAAGYAVPFTGPGLWGTIRGYMGVSADMKKVLGVGFTEQSETPGLGGRIDEPWYKEQFRGIELKDGQSIQYGNMNEKKVDAITGATITSNSVLKILNSTVGNDLPKLEVKE